MAIKAFAFSSNVAVRSVAVPRTVQRKLVAVRAQAPENTPDVTPTPTPTPVITPTSAGFSFGDAMAFAGPVPETVNGRLAMLGCFSALGAELASGETVSQQISDAPLPILLAFLAFAAASIVPLVRGADMKKPFGIFTPAAELVNGRAAMVGLIALLAVEYFKGAALF